MSSFGLGLVLNFVDNASSGMSSAVNGLNNLSQVADQMTSSFSNSAVELYAVAASMSAVGDTMTSIGSSIISTLTGIAQTVIDTGGEFFGYRMQLSALYGGVAEGEAKLQQMKDYAQTSIFTVEGLLKSVTMMKVVGIEAMDEVATSSGNTVQTLLDYASDIAAMMPNIRNVYGVGVAGAMGALKEYIAEGNAMTLKRSAGLDIVGLLGEEKGATIEERSRQVADLVEQLGIAGYTASLMGTPTQILSNMSDYWVNFLDAVSSAGVYERYTEILSKIGLFVEGLVNDTDRYNALVSLLSDIVTSFLDIADALIDKILAAADAITKWAGEHPKLAKNIIMVAAAIGGLLVVSGTFMKATSGILMFVVSLRQLTGGASIVKMLATSFSTLFSTILPLVAIGYAVYYAWNQNWFGIQDKVTRLFNVLKLVSAYFSNGFFTDEEFDLANQMGILPLIEKLATLRYYWDYFKQGFSLGWNAVFDAAYAILQKIVGVFQTLFGFDLSAVFAPVTDFFNSLLGLNLEDKWTSIGEGAGKIVALALSLLSVYKVIKLVSGVSKVGGGLLGGLFGGKGLSTSGGLASSSGGLLSKPGTVAKTMGSLAIIIGSFALIVLALGALTSIPGFSGFMSNGVTTLTQMFSNMLPLVAGVGMLTLLIYAFDKLNVSPMDALKGMADLGIILGGFALIVTAVGALASIPGFGGFISNGVTTFGKLTEAMSSLVSPGFLVLCGAIVGLGFVSPMVVLSGLLGLAIIIGGFALIISAFSALALIPGFNDFLERGGETLAILFEQIGLIFGSLIGGFAAGITSSLPAIADNLASFGDKLRPFFASVEGAPLDSLGNFMVAFGAFMLMMTGNEILSFFTGGVDFPSLAASLSEFGTAAEPFFTAVAGYPEDGISKSVSVFEALGSIGGNVPRTGGIAQFFAGEIGLAEIGSQLADFAPNGATFFNTVATYSDDGLAKAPDVFKALAGVGDYDFKFGGVAQLFTGSTSLDIIGEQLAAFAPNGATFFNTVAGYSESGIEKSVDVFDALGAIGDYDFRSGGIAQLFTGSVDLGGIGEQLAAFAPNAATFFDTASTFNDTGIDRGLRALQTLSLVGGAEFRSGGLLEFFTGSSDLGNVGSQLTDFANNASSFFTTMGTLSQSSIDNGQSALNALQQVGSMEFRSGGLLQAIVGEVDLSSIGSELSAFADSSANFFNTAATFSYISFYNAGKVFDTLNGIDGFLDTAISLNSVSLADIGTDLSTFVVNVKQFFDEAGSLTNLDAVTLVATTLEGFFTTINGISLTQLTNITTGLNDMSDATLGFDTSLSDVASSVSGNSTLISTAVDTMVSSANSSLSSFVSSGYGFGSSLVSSIASGISDNSGSISNAIKNAASGINISVGVNFSYNAVPHAAEGITDFAGGLIQVNERGGELINLPSGSTVMPHDESLQESFSQGVRIGAQAMSQFASNVTAPAVASVPTATPVEQSNDYSVTFAAGSVVIQLANASDAELEKTADKLMKIIERKQHLRDLTVRK